MLLLAIDPGPIESAIVAHDGQNICLKGKAPNDDVAVICHDFGVNPHNRCAIEMIASYGMPVGREVFETCVWIGRFMEVFGPARVDLITRLEVKNHICHSSRATDANIRQALIDRLGKPGTKKNPGPTFGVTKDVWAALAVAITWMDRYGNERSNN